MAAVGHSALGQYSSATSQVLSTVDKTADFWTQGARTLTDRLPGLPQIDLIPAVERDFDFVQGTVGIKPPPHHQVGGGGRQAIGNGPRPAESAGNLVRQGRIGR